MTVSALLVSKSVEKAIEAAVGKAEKQVKMLIRVAYEQLIATSPFYSGYYRSNHRISVRDAKGRFKSGGGGAGFKLVPRERPPFPKRGSLDRSGIVAGQELAKLKAFKLGDVVVLTTAVPYADEIEQKHGVYAGVRALVS